MLTSTLAELDDLQTAARGFLARAVDEPSLRRHMSGDTGYDAATNQRLAQELELQGIALPEHFGGGGGSLSDLLIVLVELGRSLACVPFLSTVVLSSSALLASGDEQAAADLLPGVADGSQVIALAVAESSLAWSKRDIATTATLVGSGYQVTGIKRDVVDAQNADTLLVAAWSSDGMSLLRVDAASDGVEIEPRRTVDESRRLADIRLANAPAVLVGVGGAGWSAIERARDAALLALVADASGGIQHLVDMTVEHAKSRHQFGQPIGSFQAVKHQVADMVVAERAVARALDIARWGADSASDRPLLAASLHAYCTDAYVTVAESAIQVHGGIGFTEEHTAHFYLKRAHVNRALLGLPSHHRDRAAALIGV